MTCDETHDSDTLDETGSDYGYESHSDDCGDTHTTRWEVLLTANPDSNYDEEPEEVKGSGKFFWLNSYWEDVPEKLYPDYCAGYEAVCNDVSFYVRQGTDSEASEYQFTDEQPNDDGGDYSAVYDVGFAVASAGATHPIAKAGVAAMGAWFSSGSSSAVDYEDGRLSHDNDRRYAQWDIRVSGTDSDSFANDPCDTNSVRYKIDNLTGDNEDERTVDTFVKYDFELPQLDSYSCCDDAGGPMIVYYMYDTGWIGQSHNIVLY